MNNKLYRSATNRVFGGVCGGLGDYFEVDPTLVRVVFVVLALWGGVGILLYLVLLVVMPVNPEHDPIRPKADREIHHQANLHPGNNSRHWLGLGLVLLGLLFLADSLNRTYMLVPMFNIGTVLFPLALVFLGIWIVARSRH